MKEMRCDQVVGRINSCMADHMDPGYMVTDLPHTKAANSQEDPTFSGAALAFGGTDAPHVFLWPSRTHLFHSYWALPHTSGIGSRAREEERQRKIQEDLGEVRKETDGSCKSCSGIEGAGDNLSVDQTHLGSSFHIRSLSLRLFL